MKQSCQQNSTCVEAVAAGCWGHLEEILSSLRPGYTLLYTRLTHTLWPTNVSSIYFFPFSVGWPTTNKSNSELSLQVRLARKEEQSSCFRTHHRGQMARRAPSSQAGTRWVLPVNPAPSSRFQGGTRWESPENKLLRKTYGAYLLRKSANKTNWEGTREKADWVS